MPRANVLEVPGLHGRTHVFSDRAHAGKALAGMLHGRLEPECLIMAIPAGGVPVGAALAAALQLPLGLAVVSKITLPWNSEVGFGAVAFDGSVSLNDAMIGRAGLSREQIEEGIARTRRKVADRIARLASLLPGGEPAARDVVLVDDGLASGFTMRAAVDALVHAGAASVRIAVPTGHLGAVEALAPAVRELYCANIRSGFSYAVADAYVRWHDVDEQELTAILSKATG